MSHSSSDRCSPRSSARCRSGVRWSRSPNCRKTSCPEEPIEKAFVKNAKIFQAGRTCAAAARADRLRRLYTSDSNKGARSSGWIALLLVLAGIMGLFVVFPIGGADMPVVISLLNAHDRAVRCRSRFGAEQHRDDRRRHDRRRVGFDPDQPDGRGDEPLHSGHRRSASFGSTDARQPGADAGGDQGPVKATSRRRRGDPDGLRVNQVIVVPGLRPGRRPGTARRQGDGRTCWRPRALRSSSPSTRWPAACPAT